MAIIIKTPEQIAGIRRSAQLAGQTLAHIAPFVKAGVNTEELDNEIARFMAANGAKAATLGYKGYPKSSCISLNDVVCHGIPDSKTILKEGDILNIDVTTILDGYFGDTSMMFTVGTVTDYAKELIESTRKALYLGIAQCTPGNRLGNVGYAIDQYVRSKGYSTVYEFCGHGVGIKFHEEPEVAHIAERGTGPVLKPGMIFTVEPMINAGKARCKVDKRDGWTARTIDGKLSAQYEHTVLITENGPECLTDVGLF